ncbi:fat-like cadherin-related tumor suppressor homolog isoform X2 [Ixodes scapularis]
MSIFHRANVVVTHWRSRYSWDYSDLTTEQKPLANISEVPGNEVQDSCSLRSGDSNSRNSQMDLLPGLKDESDYVGDSENNESLDGHAPFQGYEQLLQISEDDEEGPAQGASPHRYERRPNQYLPSHCLSNDQSPADDLSEDGVVSYGFPSQGGRGFLVEGAPSSSHLSCSDLSVNNVCDMEDSDEEDDDTDNTVVQKPPPSTTTTVVCRLTCWTARATSKRHRFGTRPIGAARHQRCGTLQHWNDIDWVSTRHIGATRHRGTLQRWTTWVQCFSTLVDDSNVVAQR